MGRAKAWIRAHARGSERFGLVASSQAQRLKPHAIDVRVNVDPVQWFLNDRHDTRSSDYLEDAATEFQVQGLELDWVCVTWDADLRRYPDSWRYQSFRGDAWTTIHKEDRKRYLLNAYRVPLTRARLVHNQAIRALQALRREREWQGSGPRPGVHASSVGFRRANPALVTPRRQAASSPCQRLGRSRKRRRQSRQRYRRRPMRARSHARSARRATRSLPQCGQR